MPEPPDAAKASETGETGETEFGFRRVSRDAHRAGVRAVFDSVAPRYDLMNDLMSGGLHRLWKAALLDRLAPRPGDRLLDLAAGTGDVARGFLARVAGAGVAVVADLSETMLRAGRDRAIDDGILEGLVPVAVDAARLPFPARSFDACTIAFGLRNVTERDAALAEIRRVLRPGGRLVCLEFSRVVLPMLGALYDAYSFRVLPVLGRVVAGDAESYRYLAESIRRFPDQAVLAAAFEAAGFERVGWRNLSGGIVAIHTGWRL
ncbi:MAG: class I SAM-dependent methyltransferase [Alphaproteobacteria bacterium]|nr:class I SAM-dependent methyltransferase [Alphaproteobacteria bacterium]